MATSPTALTVNKYEVEGWTIDRVERWIPVINIRKDFLGIIDLIAVKPGAGTIGIQATSDSNVNARVKKAKAEIRLKAWLGAGNKFEVIGWKKLGGKWQDRRVELEIGDIAA